MRIQHNIAALNSYRQLGGNNNAVAKNLEKLSSGYKINRAGDDAAGLAISEKMRAQITGLETAQKNAEDGISLVQTAEGALTEVHSMLNRMAELATQSANGTYSDAVDRENLQAEVDALRAEIDRISESTNFNGINLLDGSLGGPKKGISTGEILSSGAILGDQTITATGNGFTIDFTGKSFTAGDSYLDISYVDKDGVEGTKTVAFATTGTLSDDLNNLAAAVNGDRELSKSFTAKVDGNKLVLESKETGSNATAKVTGIAVNADPTTTSVNGNGTGTLGVNAEYGISNLKNGDKLVIDGKTYEFDDTSADDGTDAKFKSGAGLLKLLEAKYGGTGEVLMGGTISGASGSASGTGISFKLKNGTDLVLEGIETVSGSTSSVSTTKQGKKQKMELEAFELGNGQVRDLKFEFTDKTGAAKDVTITVTGRATKEKTAEAIIAALKSEAQKTGNTDLKELVDNFTMKADSSGKITFEANKTGLLSTTDGLGQVGITKIGLDGTNGANSITIDDTMVTETEGVGATEIAQTPASGNRFKISARAIQDMMFAENNVSAYLDISYLDKSGNTQTKTVKFNTGDDTEEGLRNLANAINKDSDLRTYFSAGINADGDFVIESKEKGADAQAKITGISLNGDPADVTGTNNSGKNTTYNFGTKTFDATHGGTITINDKTYTYKNSGADTSKGEFKTFEELEDLLKADGITIKSDKVASGSTSPVSGTDLGNITLIDENGFDIDPEKFELVLNLDASSGPPAVTDMNASKTAGEAATFKLGALGLAEGQERELTFKYKNADGAHLSFDITVTGKATAKETAEAILEKLKNNQTFKETFGLVNGDFTASVSANGEITFTASKTGKLSGFSFESLGVKNANGAAGTTFAGEIEEGKDAHLNLKDKEFVNGDEIKIGDKTYIFQDGADGSDGETFGSIDDLKNAAKQNGVTLTGDDDYLVAKYAPKVTLDFDGRVGADMIGATIEFGGQKFQFVEDSGSYTEDVDGLTYIRISKTADAEAIATAVANAMTGMTTKADPEDPTSKTMTWTSSVVENKAGKGTIVEINSDIMGEVATVKFDGFGINLQVGDTNEDYQKVKVGINSMNCEALGVDKLNINNQTNAADAIKDIKEAINAVSAQRGKLGAVQNRLDHTINNLGVTTENITAAESRIRDTDMAEEMMAYTKNNILIQSAQAMLAQANTLPQGVLQLLQ